MLHSWKALGPDKETGAWKGRDLPEITWLGYMGELGLGLSIISLPFYVILTQPFGGGSGSGRGSGAGGVRVFLVQLTAEPASRSQLREWYPEKSLAMCTFPCCSIFLL